MSILDNIALFNTCTPEKIQRIIQQSALQHILNIYHGAIGLNEAHFLGLQRQRALLTRVLFKNSSLILFGGATINLDAGSEQTFMKAFCS